MLTKIKVYAYLTVKFYKKENPKIFSNRGERARCADPGSALIRTLCCPIKRRRNCLKYILHVPRVR